MRNEAKAANSGALTVDQAVARLNEGPKKKSPRTADDAEPNEDVPGSRRYDADARGAAPLRAEEPEALRQARGEDDDGGAEQVQDAEGDDSEAEGDESGEAELEPPKFWDAKSKERFAELPPDLQKIVLDKESERNQATAKALQESAERRKAADAEASRFKTTTDGFDKLLPHALAAFDHRWSHVNWNNVAQHFGADQVLKLQHQMQAERAGLQRLSAAKERAELLSQNRYVHAQEALMPEHAPDLADTNHGLARREELSRFLAGLGVAPDQLRRISALEAGLAYDAMQWRNAKAKADTLIKAPQESVPQKRMPAKPGGTSPRGTTQQNRIAALSHKKELTIDEAVELHNLKGQS